MTRPRALVLFVACAATAIAILGYGSARGDSNDAPPEFHRTPAAVFPGETVAVSGRGCALGGQRAQFARVHLFRYSGRDGQPIYGVSREYRVATNGDWADMFVVPGDAPPGPYGLSASCQADDMVWNRITTEFAVYDPRFPPPLPPADPPPIAKRRAVAPSTLTTMPPPASIATTTTRPDRTPSTRVAFKNRTSDANPRPWTLGFVAFSAIAAVAWLIRRSQIRVH